MSSNHIEKPQIGKACNDCPALDGIEHWRRRLTFVSGRYLGPGENLQSSDGLFGSVVDMEDSYPGQAYGKIAVDFPGSGEAKNYAELTQITNSRLDACRKERLGSQAGATVCGAGLRGEMYPHGYRHEQTEW